MTEEKPKHQEEDEQEEFGELLKYTGAGFAGGLITGAALDHFGFHQSALGQWLVRTLSGEGESLFEGIYALRQRVRGSFGSMAEAYGWGKFSGMLLPWIIDWGSRMAGIDVYGVEGFYIPFFYALSDQLGANIAGVIFLRRRAGAWGRALHEYVGHPVMLASAAIVLVVPIGLLTARLVGFSPTTQISTAVETIAANLCWLPPLVGWLMRKQDGSV
jgi:hypothetical protein